MQKNSTLVHELTYEQLLSLFEGIRNQLNELKQNYEPKIPIELLSRHELTLFLKCDLSTIHNWTKKGKLKPYGIGNRVYYKRSEVEASLIAFGKGGSNE
jgi:hypothetical protein